MAFTQTQVSQLYVSVFGRASEGEGNEFWQVKEGTMSSLANEMLASPASIEYFGATLDDNQAFIEFIYNNTLGKTIDEDPDGIAFWVGRLDAGDSKGQVVATMVAALVDGDFTGDAEALAAQAQFNNRVSVSNYTADTIPTADMDDLPQFSAFINGVTDDPATVTAALTAVDISLLPLTAGAASFDEGGSAVFNLEGGEANFTYSYVLSGVDADDVDGDLTGTVTTDADGNATLSIDLVADRATEGVETLTVSFPNTALSAYTDINDTSLDNVAPVAEAATAAATEAGSAVEGQLVATDVEGDALVFTLDAAVEGLTLNEDGSYSFDPSLNTAAQALVYTDDALSIEAAFTVTDALGATSSETLTISVDPTPLTFALSTVGASVQEGATQVFTVTASEALASDAEVTFTLLPGDGTSASTGTSTTNTADFATGAFNPLTATIAAGETTTTFEVVPVNDATTELPEGFSVQAVVAGETFSAAGTVVDATTAGGVGQTFILTTGVDTIPGLIGSANSAGTDGDDTIIALLETGASTLSALDDINGGLGDNTLRIDDMTGALTIPASAVISNIQTVNLRSALDVGAAGAGNAFDTSSIAGLTALNVTVAADVFVEAGDTTDVSISGATGDIIADGGASQTVVSSATGKSITLGATTAAEGAISVTHADQGAGVIAIDGGSAVDVSATSGTATGNITIGAATPATGAVTVTQNLNSEGDALDNSGNAIDVTGGTSVDITLNGAIVADAAADDGNALTATGVTVLGDGTTTEVSVTQNLTATDFDDPDVALIEETTVVTFAAMDAGETLIINGLTFEASANMTAAEVAQAFANLTLADTQSATGPVANGFYTDAFDAALWTTGAADGASVTFTADDDNQADITFGGTATSPTQAKAAGTAAVVNADANVSVVYGAVTIDDDATAAITTVSLDGYGLTAIGAGGSMDALTTLNLANSADTVALTTAQTALALNLDNVNDAVSLDTGGAVVTDLNIVASGADSDFALTAEAVVDLDITANADLDIDTNPLGADTLETVAISGTGQVILGSLATETGINVFNAASNSGGVSVSINTATANIGTIEEFIFSSGSDDVTLLEAAVNADITLGDGNDTLTIFADSTTVPVGAVTGGDGTDTVSMTQTSAAGFDGNENFATAVTGFERLTISNAIDLTAGDVTIDLEALGFSYVTTTGTSAAANTAILDNMANDGTVALTAIQAGDMQVNVIDAATGEADVLNVRTSGAVDLGTLAVADVETINITATADSTLDLDATSATSVVIDGWADLILDMTGNTAVTSIDASDLTGDLTVTAFGTATVTGGWGDDALTADGASDVLIGGAGDDTLTGADLTSLTGGLGLDTFIAIAPTNVNSASVITDAAAGDVIKLQDVATNNMAAFIDAAITLDPDGNPDLQNYADAAVATIAVDNTAAWFQYNNNTYIVMEDNNATNSDVFVNTEDVIVKLTGLYDLSQASFNATDGTLEMV